MAETKCFIPNQLLDLDQIQQEAKHRWLRPTEICEILSNYKKFEVRSSPPCMPPAGSLFLFDRKTLRYFRKDGHRWRKKKDGKIVKEAHEKLKAGSMDVLHCYYAHGEDNENFQRRSYWMLDKQFENIVLVHYREVKEGYKSGSMLQSSQSGLSPSFEQTVQTSYASDPNSVDWNEHSVSSRSNDAHSSHDLGTSSLTNGDTTGYLERDPFESGFPGVSFDPDGHDHFQDFSIPDSCVAVQQVHANSENLDVKDDETGGLKKLDSFGRWMDKEMGGDCEDSLMASDSGKYWNAIDTENDKNEVSSLSHHMQLNTDSVGPSLAKEQLFSICDFAPDWAYSGTETKVLITGTFLGDKKYSSAIKWCCMFGEIEVPAERVTETAIRCQVPSHAAGRVPFYVTCSNRLACSEVREFEYLEKPSRLADNHNISDEDEFGLLLRFSKSISLKLQRKWLGCAVVNCEKCKLKDVICSLESDKERSWRRIMEVFKGNSKELLIENLLKDKLYEWLICEAHEACRGLRALDEKGQGVVHLAAALGYEWAVVPIAAVGLGPNFRDARGRTALHWAALYGREETVVALIKRGALPGAVDDPTPSNPGGQTAADLASSRGHKGIAGYLAEADLTSHLSALSVNDNVATVSEPDVFATNEEHSLRGSLAAVRKSAHAAALIQDAFRARSFRQRQVTQNVNNSHEANDLFALTSLHKVHKTSHYEDYLHVAASRIQQNYLGWKGRNDFLKIRERIVKIQAHFRGHQVRKHYKKVVWSVGIVEKAILRWRRKSRGLRGFRPEFTRGDSAGEGEKCDEYDYLRISRRQKYIGVEKALARVHSMARHLEGRDQYMRLLKSEKLSHEESSGRSDEG